MLTDRQNIAISLNISGVPSAFEHTPAEGKPKGPHESFAFTADAASDLLTTVGHGLAAGDPVRFTTTGALPAGLALATTYYVMAGGLTADAFKVSATLGGAAVDITDAGTGTHSWQFYLTPAEQYQFDAWLSFFTNGSGMLPPMPDLPGALTLLNKLVGHHQSPAYKTWWNDDVESRDSQYRLRKAEVLVGNTDTVPVSADDTGEGDAPPVSPIAHGDPP
jgi:hypothetical protein